MESSHLPLIIKYAFTDLKVSGDNDKWSAKCKSCKLTSTEKRAKTSAFNK